MRNERIRLITGIGILTAIVIVLQLLGSFIKLGPFSISLVLIPIVVGAALFGPIAGGWLGLVFGITVLLSGDAAPFLVFSIPGTIITVILKGVLAGFVSGLVYKIFSKNQTLATILAAISCPIINTGVFLLGCFIFFMPLLETWAAGAGFESTITFMFIGLVGGNFIFELLSNAILSPVIVKVIQMGNKSR